MVQICIQAANSERTLLPSYHHKSRSLLAPCTLTSATGSLPDLLAISMCYARPRACVLVVQVEHGLRARGRAIDAWITNAISSNAFASSVIWRLAGGFVNPVAREHGPSLVSPRQARSEYQPHERPTRLDTQMVAFSSVAFPPRSTSPFDTRDTTNCNSFECISFQLPAFSVPSRDHGSDSS